MALNEDNVRSIAHLARLSMTDEERGHYTEELSTILDFVEVMRSIDTTDVVPMAHPHHATQRLRPDVVTETDQREKFQHQAPATEDGLYLVPKVID
ncbi:MAG: Asp-tRNA(Asn)/Glu-tRNA(Gln) amidotransferase subunit GatC [Gammaproteobacteria bacterium]|nr:Asp-tRNA(Asn)/Glu-tRNA(Gln) amidotransferase subunit GatC [Gammaproteobacteria bacterium]